MKWIVAAGFLAALASSGANAGFMNGQELHADMTRYNGETPDFKAFSSAGYVVGVADSMTEVLFCIPNKTTRAQIFQVATNYLNAHPEQWQFDASSLLVEAFKGVWPCPKKN